MIPVYGHVIPGEVKYISSLGGRYIGSTHWGGTTTQALVADRLYYMPFHLAYSGDIDAIAFRVTTAAGTNARCGLYQRDPDGNPGDLLITSGDMDPSGIGGKIDSSFTTQNFDINEYYIAIVSDGTTTVRANTPNDIGPDALGLIAGAYQGVGVLYEDLGGSWAALPAVAAAVPTYDSSVTSLRVVLRKA